MHIKVTTEMLFFAGRLVVFQDKSNQSKKLAKELLQRINWKLIKDLRKAVYCSP